MIEELVNRKKLELEQKVEALENELESWSVKSESNGVFEKHNTQIRAVQAQMRGWNTRVRQKLSEYREQSDPEIYLSKCANAEKLILSEHRIWDYFRSKFIQRNETTFNVYLQAADEFAWACYKPVQETVYPDIASARRKEPPLVFFNGGTSPFSVSRDRSFQLEVVAGESISIDPKDLINKLPIPVVGVPWHQINHLPEALIIGHEIGHIVEDDFALTERLKELLDEALAAANAPEERTAAWHSWLGEIFADLYGCLAAGAAFAGTLIDYLAKDKNKISAEQKTAADWGRYPTDYLRVRIILHALEIMNFENEVKNYKLFWENYTSKMPNGFSSDVDFIVPALLRGKHNALGGKSILEVFCFSNTQQRRVNDTVSELGKIKPDTTVEIPSTDIRVLFAALRTAYEKTPAEYIANHYGSVVLKHIEAKVLKPGVRSGEMPLSPKQLKSKMEANQRAGEDLIESIL